MRLRVVLYHWKRQPSDLCGGAVPSVSFCLPWFGLITTAMDWPIGLLSVENLFEGFLVSTSIVQIVRENGVFRARAVRNVSGGK